MPAPSTVSLLEDVSVEAPSRTAIVTQNWTVPSGVTSITFELRGAPGNEPTGGANSIGTLSAGGVVTGTLAVTPGDEWQLRLSGRGTVAPTNSGGYGGTAAWLIPKVSGVFNIINAVAVAGGGGGNGGNNVTFGPAGVGGAGGGTTGAAGAAGRGTNFGNPGQGGTPSAGGAGGTGGAGANGSPGTAGNGGAGGGTAGTRSGGGGGGGWYGGGGGERADTSGGGGGGGGGGSSYVDGVVTGSSSTQGANTGVAAVYIYIPGTGGIYVDGAVHLA
jgi:hypothetical protein